MTEQTKKDIINLIDSEIKLEDISRILKVDLEEISKALFDDSLERQKCQKIIDDILCLANQGKYYWDFIAIQEFKELYNLNAWSDSMIELCLRAKDFGLPSATLSDTHKLYYLPVMPTTRTSLYWRIGKPTVKGNYLVISKYDVFLLREEEYENELSLNKSLRYVKAYAEIDKESMGFINTMCNEYKNIVTLQQEYDCLTNEDITNSVKEKENE